MAALTLKINVVDLNLVKTMTFDAKSSVQSACEQINKKLQDTSIHKQFKRKYPLVIWLVSGCFDSCLQLITAWSNFADAFDDRD